MMFLKKKLAGKKKSEKSVIFKMSDNNNILFKQEDWQLFTNANTLSQKAGVPTHKILKLVAKELTDNALDTGTDVEIGYLKNFTNAPNITADGFFVKDNGAGIKGTDSKIANLFSIKRPLLSSKRLRIPQRGALGNGLRVVTGAIISLDGSIEVATNGRILKIIPKDNGETGYERIGEYNEVGTLIKVMINDKRYCYDNSLEWANLSLKLTGGEYYRGKTSPFWFDSDSFYDLLKATPNNTYVRDFISSFDGCSGGKAGKITKDYSCKLCNEINREESEDILKKAREIAKEVKPKRLGCIGDIKDSIAYHKEYTVFTVKAGRGNIDTIMPAVIEIWAMDNSEETDYYSQIFVNRTPITGEVKIEYYNDKLHVNGCGLHNYWDKKFKITAPIWLNIITPYMPITTDGKEPNLTIIDSKSAITDAIYKLANKVNRQAPKEIKRKKRSEKSIVEYYLDEAIDKVSGNGKYRYSQRQLFYTITPYIKEELNKELKYSNFTQIITDIENKLGKDLPKMYRDARGIILHPHTNEEIPLGTLTVENYKRPEYYFNKVLYLEKEGFFQILKSEKIHNFYDLAIITNKGISNRSAKDLIDLLAKTDEEIDFFCIHDFDASGTMIYQSLQNETKSRGARKVKIIDLGLKYEDVEKLNLEIEKTKYKKRQPVAKDYEEYKDWLQHNRVELNAMDSPTFIKWIRSKLDEYNKGKVIPPENYMKNFIIAEGQSKLRQLIREKIENQLNIDELIDKNFEGQYQKLEKILNYNDLNQIVKNKLTIVPENNWRAPLDIEITKIINKMMESLEIVI